MTGVKMNNVVHAARVSRPKILVSSLYPMGGNYGGMLQAYALQEVIRRLGYDVSTIDSQDSLRLRTSLRKIYHGVRKTVFGIDGPIFMTKQLRSNLWVKTIPFVENNISTIGLFDLSRRARNDYLRSVGAIVVGSDQVWRKPYADLPKQFLAYVKSTEITRISYAASFGKSDINEYSRYMKYKTGFLLAKFDHVSVREDSGVRICRDHWNISAAHHVDPTLLLEPHDYQKFVAPGVSGQTDKSMFVYVLDQSSWSRRSAGEIGDQLELNVEQFLTPRPKTRAELEKNIDKYRLRPVEDWIQGIASSKFVLTDSFHGTIFAILFNRPFLVVENPRRGVSRISSLLKMLGLEDRLLESGQDISHVLQLPNIDWSLVNRQIDMHRDKGQSYLREALANVYDPKVSD